MSRRLEITVPNEWVPPIQEILYSPNHCNFGKGGKPSMIVEVTGKENSVFFVTIPGPSVSTTLEILRKNGIGTSVGRIILSTLDYMKPDLTKPLAKSDLTVDNMAATDKKAAPAPLKGFQHFQKARKTTEEMYNEISNNANMTINTWMNLVGASVMAAGGLTTGVLVFVVAAMLVSPIMGPILGMTMGYRVADWPLFKTGFINEIKMAIVAYGIGCCFGVVLGDVGNTYKWPNNAMMAEGQGFNLIISIIVSAAAGLVLGVSLTAAGGNALVGTAISAGLLPPLVNSGMLMAYSTVWATPSQRKPFYQMGVYAILFYFTHVITIVIVANFVFWLKDVDPRFREGEDSNFNDIPTLVEHKKRLEELGKNYTEKDKAEFFIEHIKEDLKKDMTGFAQNIKGTAEGFANIISGGIIGSRPQRRGSQTQGFDVEVGDEEDNHGTVNPIIHSSKKVGNSKFSALSQNDEGDVEMNVTKSYKPLIEEGKLSEKAAASGFQSAPLQSKPPLSNSTITVTNTPRERVVAFYKQYNPEKLSSIQDILTRYQGKEMELLRKLHKQYNIPMEDM